MAPGTAVIVGVEPGLGVALARAFANTGHPVAMLDIDKARLDTDAAELASAGRDVRGYVADVPDSGNLRAALHSAITELGAPDVLVYHVGAVRKDSSIGGDDQDWADVPAVRADYQRGGQTTPALNWPSSSSRAGSGRSAWPRTR